jgi:hypothetical protein
VLSAQLPVAEPGRRPPYFPAQPRHQLYCACLYFTEKNAGIPFFLKTRDFYLSTDQFGFLINKRLESEIFIKAHHAAIGVRIDFTREWLLQYLDAALLDAEPGIGEVLDGRRDMTLLPDINGLKPMVKKLNQVPATPCACSGPRAKPWP